MFVLFKVFVTSYREKSKQLAEQAAAIIGLIVLGEDDGRKPGSESPNDEVIKVWREEFHKSDDTIYKHKAGNFGKETLGFPGSSDSKNRNSAGDTYERNGIEITHITDGKKFELGSCDKSSNDFGEGKHNLETMSPQKSGLEHQSVSSTDLDS